MVIAINPKATFEYVLEADRELPQDQQTVWILGYLTLGERAEIEDGIAFGDAEGRTNYRVGSTKLETLRRALRDVRNFVDESGREVPLETQGQYVHPRFLDRLADAWATELSNEVDRRSRVTEKDSD